MGITEFHLQWCHMHTLNEPALNPLTNPQTPDPTTSYGSVQELGCNWPKLAAPKSLWHIFVLPSNKWIRQALHLLLVTMATLTSGQHRPQSPYLCLCPLPFSGYTHILSGHTHCLSSADAHLDLLTPPPKFHPTPPTLDLSLSILLLLIYCRLP